MEQASFCFPSQLIHAVKPAIATLLGGAVVDVMTLPSAVALGAPSRIRVLFAREANGTMMSVSAVRWGEAVVPIGELNVPWAPHWLATLTAAIGAEVRRRRVAHSTPPPKPRPTSAPPALAGSPARHG